MSYEKDTAIDINSLEEEWLEQPRLYKKYSDLLAEAEKEKNEMKEELELVKAELDGLIRMEAKESGEKITEKGVEAKILQEAKYQDTQEKYLQALHDYQVIKGSLTGMEHRKSALENLVKLWIGGYFSTPKSPKGTDMKESSKKKTQIKARKKLNKK